MDDVARSKSVLGEVKALGVSIALDDFGTGYSSLSYLKGFQLDTLKIDRTFTAELPASEVNASIVRATIGLAKGLRLRTIAEGVETRAQADFLVAAGLRPAAGLSVRAADGAGRVPDVRARLADAPDRRARPTARGVRSVVADEASALHLFRRDDRGAASGPALACVTEAARGNAVLCA